MSVDKVGVVVTGIPELSRALKATNADLAKELRVGFKKIAQHVIGEAEKLGAPSGILRPRAGIKGAGIAFPRGGPDSGADPVGFYPWLDFGGGQPLGRGVRAGGAGPRRRSVVKEGRYLYPGIGQSTEYIVKTTYDLVEHVAEHNRFEVRK